MKKLTILALALCTWASVQARHTPEWLNEACIYHIYPSTFKDSDGDGIGDLEGIRSKLDYIREMGFNTIWISPIFRSAFEDGGYDITDFYEVDPRFGTNSGLVAMIDEAHAKGIRVCLDLVAGHTSDKHPWFRQSMRADKNLQYSDYYIWTDGKQGGKPEKKFVDNDAPRNGYYLKNYYDIQPALNYGYAHPDPSKSWQQAYDAPGPTAVRNELKRVIAFWCDKGVDGFRVDLAPSLVKGDDAQRTGIKRLWNEIFDWYEQRYPENIMLSEWSQPRFSIDAGFDVDLIIHNGIGEKIYRPLVCQTSNSGEPTPCYFDKAGQGQVKSFAEAYAEVCDEIRGQGFASMPVCSHDIWRMNRFDRNTPDQLKTVLTFFLTLPMPPIVYYGEEIGMRNIENAPDKEGSLNVKNRSSCRTPMQWDTTPNAGFSTAEASKLYLPIDADAERPNVATQQADPNSILNYVKRLLALRAATPALGTDGAWKFVSDPERPYPMVYMREKDGEKYLVALNPSSKSVKADFAAVADGKAEIVYGTADKARYATAKGRTTISMRPVSAVIWKVR